MNAIIILGLYFLVGTLGAVITQFTGKSGRNLREALLVWWFLPLVLIYVFSSFVFEGAEGFSKSLRDFRNELMNT